MEWIINMSLKKSFFIITTLFLLAAIVLSIPVISALSRASLNISLDAIIISLDDDNNPIIDMNIYNAGISWYVQILNLLQVVLPVLIFIFALLLSSVIFYRLKLKKPLTVLQSGAERIRQQDLDFNIEKYADDELGILCATFETMRHELLKSNRELWRLMEERKRLNAAFSHDLRNPVTVLKGSAAILTRSLENGSMSDKTIKENISLIEQYTARIENYIEAMTDAQKLEDLKCNPVTTTWSVLARELENSLSILGADARKEISFTTGSKDKQIRVDSHIVHNTAENLTSNALRYAKDKVLIDLSCDDEKITISVSDNGDGFSPAVLDKGAVPFLRDNNSEQGVHFGMGLYICRLMCEKHGGSLMLENMSNGARTTATFYF